VDVVIELVSTALVDWFSSIETSSGDQLDVSLASPGTTGRDDRPDAEHKGAEKRGRAARAHVELRLVSVRDCNDRRTHDVEETRDSDGRVIARRGATRYFDVDYSVTTVGDPLAAHASVGAVIQALVDNDLIPVEFLPDTLDTTQVDVTITPDEARSLSDRACLSIRAVVAVRPTEQTDIAPPAESLHLDVGPPPRASASPAGSIAGAPTDTSTGPVDLADRRWTTVRRRESIATRTE
jgi:hypothetical protein